MNGYRPGPKIFASADYASLELCAQAQICVSMLGRSRLAEILREGKTPLLSVAGNILGLSYEQTAAAHKAEKQARAEAQARGGAAAALAVPTPVDDARQTGKVACYGLPGGLGARTLVFYARKTYGVRLGRTQHEAEQKAKWLKGVWLETLPEFHEYFRMVSSWERPDGTYTVRQLFSNRIRAGCTYPAACNTLYQGLGADLSGEAVYEVQRAAYAIPESPLFGSRMINYVHDDYILECEEETGHDTATELVRIMVAVGRKWLPAIPIGAEPQLMRYWSKDAKPVFRETPSGKRLIPWPDKS